MVGTQDADRYARSRSIWIDALHPERTPPAIEIHVRAYRVYIQPPQGVYTPQHEVYVEARLHPTDGVTLHLHQPPDMTLDEDTAIRKALPRAKQLLRTLEPPGRPDGSGAYKDRDTFLAALTTAVQHITRTGRWPSQEHVVQHLGQGGMSVRHLQRLFKKHVHQHTRETWQAFVAHR